jgi:hypothetical protein
MNAKLHLGLFNAGLIALPMWGALWMGAAYAFGRWPW